MKTIFGLLLILGGIVLGLWLGVWVLFIGGIVDVIDQIRAPEISAMAIAWGIVKILCASAVGSIAAMVLIVPGWGMVTD